MRLVSGRKNNSAYISRTAGQNTARFDVSILYMTWMPFLESAILTNYLIMRLHSRNKIARPTSQEQVAGLQPDLKCEYFI